MLHRGEATGFRAALGLLMLATVATAADAPAPARWAPADAALYVEVTQPNRVVDRLTGGRLQGLFKAVPAYRRALDGPQWKHVLAVADLVAKGLDTDPEKGLRSLVGGGVTLVVEGPDRAYVAITPTDRKLLEKAHAKLVELARQDAATKGNPDPVKEADYRGVHAYSVGSKEAHAILDGVLVIASGDDMLKRVIERAKPEKQPSAGLADKAEWIARRAALGPDTVAWAFVGLERLRQLDPKKFGKPDKADVGQVVLFGPWLDAARTAPWASLRLDWTEDRLASELTIPTPKDGYPKPLDRFTPPAGSGAPVPIKVPGTVLTVGLWRDLSALWEARGELFPPEAQQGLAQLDTFAGTFFGGRDFGTGVLGSLSNNWRLVVARQDAKALKPMPDVKLPAFALVIDVKPDDADFAQRLKVAFQSFIGLANLNTAQTKAPPLELGSEAFEGITIATAHYMPPKAPKADEPVPQRYNYSPSAAQVGDHFIISSSLGLAKDLIRGIKAPAPAGDATLLAEAEGAELAALIGENKTRLVDQNMLEKGNDKAKAEEEIDLLADLVRYLGHASLKAEDAREAFRLRLQFDLQGK